MKVLIDFPADFETEALQAIPLGRITVGNHIARLFFSTDGKMRMSIPQAALHDGSVVVWSERGEQLLDFTVSVVLKP